MMTPADQGIAAAIRDDQERTERTLTPEQLDRLEEIREEIDRLAHEAFKIVNRTTEGDRAKGYWYAQIRMALDDSHGYLGRGSVTMRDSIDALTDELADAHAAKFGR